LGRESRSHSRYVFLSPLKKGTGEKLISGAKELQTITSISGSELIRNLQALAVAPKTRILLKKPMSRDVRPTDVFSFNEDFSSKFMRIRIGVVATNRAETDKERKETEEKVDEYRALKIEAAVVRIMKQRKTLGHTELMSEVLSQLSGRFTPDMGMIKKRIESLMERDYMERVAGERQSYRYLVRLLLGPPNFFFFC
jgi:cullin 3